MSNVYYVYNFLKTQLILERGLRRLSHNGQAARIVWIPNKLHVDQHVISGSTRFRNYIGIITRIALSHSIIEHSRGYSTLWDVRRSAIQLHTQNKQSHLRPLHNCLFVSRFGPMVSFRSDRYRGGIGIHKRKCKSMIV